MQETNVSTRACSVKSCEPTRLGHTRASWIRYFASKSPEEQRKLKAAIERIVSARSERQLEERFVRAVAKLDAAHVSALMGALR